MTILYTNQTSANKRNDIFSILKDCSTDEFNLEAPVQGIGYVRKFRECFTIDKDGSFTESILVTQYISNFIDENLDNYDTVNIHFFTLKDLGFDQNVITLLEPFIWGYSCNSNDQKIYAVYSAYNGLIITTVFWNDKALLATDNLLDILKFRKTSKKLKNFLINEVNFELQQITSQYPNYQEFLTKNKDKLENRYKNSRKLR